MMAVLDSIHTDRGPYNGAVRVSLLLARRSSVQAIRISKKSCYSTPLRLYKFVKARCIGIRLEYCFVFHKENKHLFVRGVRPNRMNILADAFQAGGMTHAGPFVARRSEMSACVGAAACRCLVPVRTLWKQGWRTGAARREKGVRVCAAAHGELR